LANQYASSAAPAYWDRLLARGRPVDEAFALGVAAGTATVTTMGTELCRREMVEALYEEIRGQV
jgi:fructose-1-phosphate kinase PfkB-like protein